MKKCSALLFDFHVMKYLGIHAVILLIFIEEKNVFLYNLICLRLQKAIKLYKQALQNKKEF